MRTGPAAAFLTARMREIYIRRMKPSEARPRLEAELNRAFMDGLERVRVVHGIGDGVLRRLVREVVAEYDFCAVFESPLSELENPGATQVDLYPP